MFKHRILRGEIISKSLELDGYNKNLGLAFEYNGEQHYKMSYYYSDLTDLFYRIELDKIKKEACEKRKVTLITIPYTISNKYLFHYIWEECVKVGFESKMQMEWI
jgi:hypothetical protein